MVWLGKTKAPVEGDEKRTLGEGIFQRCDGCATTVVVEELAQNWQVCPNCGHHHRLEAERWLELLLDPNTFEECDQAVVSGDPLGFVDSKSYVDRLRGAQSKAEVDEAIRVGSARLSGRPIQVGVFVFRFMGGSMGSAVGEKIARVFERGAELRQPVVLLSTSGGARMQEGALSLMQMAKTVSALSGLRRAGLPFVSVLLNPTTGGVAASFALLGDVNIVEPNALVGFAGPRVIENTIRQQLPEGFQRAEFLQEHGMVDLVTPRGDMRATLSRLLSHLLD